jgi:hypothetical protein
MNAATSSFAQESDVSSGELSTFDPLFDPALFGLNVEGSDSLIPSNSVVLAA